MLWWGSPLKAMRDMFRQWPEARESFVGDGRWIQFSRRFGLRFAIPALVAPFAWIIVGAKLVDAKVIPDTNVGAWLIFGPALVSMFVGVILGGLVIVRWVVDEL